MFQEKLCMLILDDRSFADQIEEILDIKFLELNYLRVFLTKIYDYRKKYGVHPSRDIMKVILRSELEEENELVRKQVTEFFVRYQISDVSDIEYIKDTTIDFCKKQNLKSAMIKSIGLLQSSSFDEISKVINDALKLGDFSDEGYDWLKDFEERFKPLFRNPITTGWPLIDDICKGGLGQKELGVVVASAGCHAKGSKIMLSNGSLINVEDIKVGDKLMGPDSKFRTVLKLHRGKETMYNIIPVKGESFVVNGGHILSLKRSGAKNTRRFNEILNISVKDWLNKSKYYKSMYKLYRAPVEEFEGGQSVYEPYFVGLMLGDGSLRANVRFSSADNILAEEIKRVSKQFGVNIREYKKAGCTDYALTYRAGIKNPIAEFFEKLGLNGKTSGEKFIPLSYKLADRASRLELLAGILDTDGHMGRGGFDYISKSKKLASDVTFVARSLGLAAYLKKTKKSCQTGYTGTYYRVSISGDCSIIPTRLERKRAGVRKQIKNVLVTGFTVEKMPEDDYYGFEVDKDNLYLMGDFTVTHNSGKSMALVHLGAQALKQGKNVVHYTLELRDTVVASRYDSCLTKLPLANLGSFKDKIFEEVQQIDGRLIVKEYPTKSASTNTIVAHLEKLKMKNVNIDMVIVDYADLLRPILSQREKRNELESIYEELRGIASEYEVPVWTASQTNRCFSADTTTYILEGKEVRKKHMNELVVGDSVETIKGYKKIIDINKFQQKTFTITLKNGKKIKVSGKHQFPTDRGLLSLNDGLCVGDKLLTKKTKMENNNE